MSFLYLFCTISTLIVSLDQLVKGQGTMPNHGKLLMWFGLSEQVTALRIVACSTHIHINTSFEDSSYADYENIAH